MNPLTADWQTFFGAELGATASLTGLVVVAMSVNLSRILDHPLLPGRALETLFALMGGVLLSSLLLIPHQPARALAIECGLVGVFSLFAPLRFQAQAFFHATPNAQARPFTRAMLSCMVGGAVPGRRVGAVVGGRRGSLLGCGRRDPVAAGRRDRRLGAAGGDHPLGRGDGRAMG